MSIAAERKKQVVTDYQRHGTDVGSPEVQVAILTTRIQELTEHLRPNRHDHAARRGLVMMVGKRNRLLRYLQRNNRTAYQELIKRLGLRK